MKNFRGLVTQHGADRRFVMGIAVGIMIALIVQLFGSNDTSATCTGSSGSVAASTSSQPGTQAQLAIPQAPTPKYWSLKKRMFVVAKQYGEEWRWIPETLKGIPYAVYEFNADVEMDMHDKVLRQVMANKGGVAMAYLQFITENYYDLPDTMVFMQAHYEKWYQQDKPALLERLKWGSFPFANLRYAPSTSISWMCRNATHHKVANVSLADCNYQGHGVLPAGHQVLSLEEGYLGTSTSGALSELIATRWENGFKHVLGDAPFSAARGPAAGSSWSAESAFRPTLWNTTSITRLDALLPFTWGGTGADVGEYVALPVRGAPGDRSGVRVRSADLQRGAAGAGQRAHGALEGSAAKRDRDSCEEPGHEPGKLRTTAECHEGPRASPPLDLRLTPCASNL
eukprot:jgi/Botrbrau1/15156/Bobra.0149s0024.1